MLEGQLESEMVIKGMSNHIKPINLTREEAVAKRSLKRWK